MSPGRSRNREPEKPAHFEAVSCEKESRLDLGDWPVSLFSLQNGSSKLGKKNPLSDLKSDLIGNTLPWTAVVLDSRKRAPLCRGACSTGVRCGGGCPSAAEHLEGEIRPAVAEQESGLIHA